MTENNVQVPVEQGHLRFSGANWYKHVTNASVGVVGLGGIGSWTAFLLARAGFKRLHLYDFDVVDVHNLGGQLYDSESIGQPKAHAMASIIRKSTHAIVKSFRAAISEIPPVDILIMAVDNISARQYVAEKLAFSMFATTVPKMVIDGRMTAESAQIHTYNIYNVDEYLEKLPREEDISEGPCSFRATSFNGAIIGGLITSIAVNSFTPFNSVPKLLSYHLPLMKFDCYEDLCVNERP